jgi:hypothetical protein
MLLRILHVFLLFALSAAGAVKSAAIARGRQASADTFEANIKPLLSQYCFGCHGGGKSKGDLALDQWGDESAARKDSATWQRVLKKIQAGEMPPENKPQPSSAERQRLAKWIETEVFQCDCDHPDPGGTPIRRLNRAEYNNTIRDLLGVDFKPADDFPVDDSGHGFDNMADALSLSPVLVEKYLAAAEKIVNTAFVLNGPPRPASKRFPVDALEIGYNARQRGDGWVFLNSIEEDDVAVNFESPVAGDFAVRVHAYARQESSNAIRITLMLGAQPIQTVIVETNATAPRVYETRMKLAPGKNRVRAVVRRMKDVLPEAEALRWKSGENQKGAVFVEWLEIEGPLAISPELPETHRRVFTTTSQIGTYREVARDVLGRFVRRAYRRPVAHGEVDRLVNLASESWQAGDTFEQGIARAIQATLVSPHFLFRDSGGGFSTSQVGRGVLTAPLAATSGGLRTARPTMSIHDVDEFTLASRLSYFLWSSMPDERLFALAEKNELRRHLDSEVKRMLGDPKSRALVNNFAGQWLQIRNLELATPDKDLFPKFDEDLRAAMRLETDLLFLNVLEADRSIFDFLNADYTYVNERLAKHYRIDGVRGPEFQRVSLRNTSRRGVLTHASVLTLTSNPTRTSPVKRGKWVLETLLNAPPPPPPPDVPELKEGKELTGTLRQRMEQHRADTLCASCHARMDPIGFALENFDAVGAWREKDGKEPVDATGELATGEKIQGAADLAVTLAERKQEQFVRGFTEKLLMYALGRGLEFTDKCALDEITKAVAKQDHRFSAVVLAIVQSVPFQKQRTSNAITQEK